LNELDQICHIAQIYETGEETKYQPTIDAAWFQYFKNLLTHAHDDHIDENALSIHKTSMSQFTCQQLQSCSDFKQWMEAEFKQLDTHENDKMFGDPCLRPINAIVL